MHNVLMQLNKIKVLVIIFFSQCSLNANFIKMTFFGYECHMHIYIKNKAVENVLVKLTLKKLML